MVGFAVDVRSGIPGLKRQAVRARDSALDRAEAVGLQVAQDTVRVDSGDLQRSIVVRRTRDAVEIGSPLPYAAAQEFGRSDLRTYGFTPYLRPAREAMNRELVSTYSNVFQQALGGDASALVAQAFRPRLRPRRATAQPGRR